MCYHFEGSGILNKQNYQCVAAEFELFGIPTDDFNSHLKIVFNLFQGKNCKSNQEIRQFFAKGKKKIKMFEMSTQTDYENLEKPISTRLERPIPLALEMDTIIKKTIGLQLHEFTDNTSRFQLISQAETTEFYNFQNIQQTSFAERKDV